jgi:hypothetical protein
MHDYELVRQAARRWLDRSKTPEYKRRKKEALRLQWQIAALRRKVRKSRDFETLALLKFLEAEMLSHTKRVETALR